MSESLATTFVGAGSVEFTRRMLHGIPSGTPPWPTPPGDALPPAPCGSPRP